MYVCAIMCIWWLQHLLLPPSPCSQPDTRPHHVCCHKSNFPLLCEPHKFKMGERERLRYAKSGWGSHCDSGELPQTVKAHPKLCQALSWATCKSNSETLPFRLHQMCWCWKETDRTPLCWHAAGAAVTQPELRFRFSEKWVWSLWEWRWVDLDNYQEEEASKLQLKFGKPSH